MNISEHPGALPLAARVGGLHLSEIVRISEEAKRLKAAGRDVISFGTGEPDFPTPPHVVEAAITAMRAGQTTYTPTAGIPALRAAICDHAVSLGWAGGAPGPDQVIVGAGAKQVLHNAFMATLDPGDEVIIPAPYWTSYADMVGIAGGRVVDVPCGVEAGFRLSAQRFAAAITPRTRWLLLNSPGNPSGAMYTAEDLAELADVLRAHPHVGVMTDEIYGQIAYAPFTSFAAVAPDLADRMLVVNGVSKAYSMTGWRIGWGIGPVPLIRAMIAVQGQCTSGACSISQAAAVAALTGPQDEVSVRREAFRARRDLVVAALNAVPGIACPVPDGAFYAFADCRALFGKITAEGEPISDDGDFCRYLMQAAGVAVIPGRAFAMPGYFRLSYACSEASLREGCARIRNAVEALS